ncbi:Acg family FMN-binding oxidoreductase [Blastococcus atacamensis]|uniref:Acg family FMN-binding oxidoreductase n=1 Tax=Blastococcus atacamensis TaxID=2070508 RepID=UPI0018E43ABB|nr:nitroreductase family protein [Blastococcus atacamensis]
MREIDWAQIVSVATRAPSIHNTQPWRFTATADRLDVFYDRRRALPVVDPSGRQQLISCGMAVAFAEVALRAAGFAVEVELMSDPGHEDHLARLRVTGRARPDGDDRALADAIAQRHTVRAAFEPRAVPAELLDRLEREAGAHGLWFKVITRSEEEVATVFLLSQAEELEQRDPAYVRELESWVRTDPATIDGVPADAVPAGDPRDRPSNWLIRDFAVSSRERHSFRAPQDLDAPPPDVERPTVVLLGTANDHRISWLEAGQGLGRVLLVATTAGLVASPLTQALDWPATRSRLRQRLSLIGHPQMLLRVGYPPPGLELVVTGRRPVGDVLSVEPAC